MATQHEAAIALNRFGLGARPGEMAQVASDPRGWLRAQAGRAEAFALSDPRLPDRAGAVAAVGEFLQDRRIRRAARAEAAAPPAGMADMAADPVAGAVNDYARVLRLEITARAGRGLSTADSFAERLVYFWANHFTVAASKALTVPYVGLFEREVIRAGMTGTFASMALNAARHPGMLFYLDQVQSVGPNSKVGQRREAGLNENLAREILELHTLGAQGGYTQADVTEFAKALTGWTMAGPRAARFTDAPYGSFVFLEVLHEPGPRQFMGKRYPEGGEEQARAMLADACRAPATARRVGEQLARHFIADTPPQSAMRRLEQVFLETGGNLPALHRALVDLPEAWATEQRKFKTPNEFLLSALRAVGVPEVEPRAVLGAYELLGQSIFRAPSPEGWADDAASWAGPDAVMKRLEWSQALAERVGARAAPEAIASTALGPMLSARTRQAITRAESAEQGLVIALMSPEFQRR